MNMNIDYRDIITSIFYKLMFFFHVIMYNILLALLKNIHIQDVTNLIPKNGTTVS